MKHFSVFVCVRVCLCWDVCEYEVKIRTAIPSFSVDAGDPALDHCTPLSHL